MVFAYVLINCDLGFEEDIISQLKTIDEVKEMKGVFGVYDLVAKVESDDVDKLRDVITRKIRKLDRVRTTLTLMAIPGQG